jgi:hypothetical protein
MIHIVSQIVNDQIVFAEVDAVGLYRQLQSRPLGEVLESGLLTGDLPRGENTLLLVPDYWLGVKEFPLATSKPALVEPFIRKKLLLEMGESQGCEDFFDYSHQLNSEGESGVVVYFPQESQLPTLHRHLAAARLSPLCVSTPGLLWENRLRETLPGFDQGGKLLICLVGSECFFFFFAQGRFLFSRDFSVFQGSDPADRIDALAYEIKQSRFLFAQKARGEVDQVLLAAVQTTLLDLPALEAKLDRTVTVLPSASGTAVGFSDETLSPLLFFTPREWKRGSRLVNIAHRQVRKMRDWFVPQSAALAAGFVLLLLLAAVAVYLGSRASEAQVRQRSAAIREQGAQVRTLSSQLDEILQRRRVPSASDTLVRLARSLPANVGIDTFELDLQGKRTLLVQGIVHAEGSQHFKQTLLELMGNIRENFPGNEQLNYKDIVFVAERRNAGEAIEDFQITFQVNL